MEKKSVTSQRSVLRILDQHKFHPYRMSLHQDLYGNDFLKRVNFCNWIRREMRTDVSFLSHVLFSDEANFTNTGNVNRHNMHYWANENFITISTSVVRKWLVPHCRWSRHWSTFFWRSLNLARLRKLSAKRTVPINVCTEITPQMLAEVRRSFH